MVDGKTFDPAPPRQGAGRVEKTVEARVKRSEAEMCGKIRERFGELLGRLKALDPTLARAKAEFRFASERDDEITELPNPLPARAIN